MEARYRGGRRIRFTGDRACDRLRKRLMTLGVSMTDLARMLDVDKSDISHALSPRAKRKRYMGLRKRIRAALRNIKKGRLRPRAVYAKLGYQEQYDEPEQKILNLIDLAIRMNRPIPPISLRWCAESFLWNPSTFYKALRGDPRIAAWRRERAQRILDVYLRELYEDYLLMDWV